jgi:hypothetical protein
LSDKRNGRPTKSGKAKPIVARSKGTSSDGYSPLFCFAHTHNKFCVGELDTRQKADLADTLAALCTMTWRDIKLAPRHGRGTERVPVNSLKASMPTQFANEAEAVVLRYSAKLPMVGFRANRIFHIVCIEKAFGDLYDHG